MINMINEYNAKRYCCESISNIENFEIAMSDRHNRWVCHHRLELIKTGGVIDLSMQDLKDFNIYFNRPADELIFLSASEHAKLHFTGKPRSQEVRDKISKTSTGKPHPFSDEAKEHMRQCIRSRAISNETRLKCSIASKKYWESVKNHTDEQ